MADENTWVLDLSSNPPDIYNSAISEHVQNAQEPPYPSVFWYVNQSQDDVIHDGMVNYHSPCINAPYPYVFWFTNQTHDDVIHNMPCDYEPMGACNNCPNLTRLVIPESVKKIGPTMANVSGITSVTIASDCEYDSTSFPLNCTVNFYPT